MTLKVNTYFQCQECGHRATKWLGRCPSCSKWNTFTEELKYYPSPKLKGTLAGTNEKPLPITEISGCERERIVSSISELDRVLGGGIVPGSVTLICGEPGIGKSTIILQLSGKVSSLGMRVLYITGEESAHQLKIRAQRLGIYSEKLLALPENNVDSIIKHTEDIKPDFVICDSVQTLYTEHLQSAPGTVSQIRDTTARLVSMAKKFNIPIFLVGHVTKEGVLAGPRVLEHMVDTVLYLEGDRGHAFRILRTVKNRFGSTNEIGIFEMGERGLECVINPSEVFISQRPLGVSGSAVVPVMEGTRPILVEIQALVTGSNNPALSRRMSAGLDQNRVSLLIAVLEKRIGFNMQCEDIFINVAGGVRIDEPAADLGVIAAIASSFRNKEIAPETCLFGEVGLAGEIRTVSNIRTRVREAARLGFKRCIVPKNKKTKNEKGGDYDIEIIEVSSVNGAIDMLL